MLEIVGIKAQKTVIDANDLSVNLTSEGTGSILYFDGSEWIDLDLGTTGQTLTSSGGTLAWETNSTTSTALERGSSRLAANYDIIGTGGPGAFEDIGVSVTLPKAGTYELKAMITAGQIGDDQYINGVITDASGAAVSEFIPVIGTLDQSGVESFFSQGSATIIAEVTTTTDNEVFKIRIAQNSNTPLGEVNAGTTLFFDQKPTSTVIPAGATAVNDQTTSGYMDIGTMRMQWGSQAGAAGARTVILPAPFANNTYNVVAGVGSDSADNALVNFSVQTFNATTTTFEGRLTFEQGGTHGNAGEAFMWQAIGLRP